MTASQPVLSPEQVDQLRDELQRALARIERSARANGSTRPAELDQSAMGRLSRIEALQNQGLTHSLQARERHQHEQVLDALRRLEAGTYGLCTSCRRPIRFERLLVFPEARTCNGCADNG